MAKQAISQLTITFSQMNKATLQRYVALFFSVMQGVMRAANKFIKRVVLTTILVFVTNIAAGEDFIKAVKETNANVIEAELPKINFDEWIRKSFKYGGAVSWEINDCGEGGDLDNSRVPTCVEARIPSAEDYTLHISTIIGVTTELEITKPKLWMVYFYKGDGHKTLEVIRFRSISEALVEYNRRNDV